MVTFTAQRISALQTDYVTYSLSVNKIGHFHQTWIDSREQNWISLSDRVFTPRPSQLLPEEINVYFVCLRSHIEHWGQSVARAL